MYFISGKKYNIGKDTLFSLLIEMPTIEIKKYGTKYSLKKE
jgi:hypothetical protein